MRRGLCRRKYGGVTRLIRGMRLARGGRNRGGGVEMEMEMEMEREREREREREKVLERGRSEEVRGGYSEGQRGVSERWVECK